MAVSYDEFRNMGVSAYTPQALNIGGALDFGSAPSLSPDGYMGAYQNALNLNRSNYNNILQGYQNLNQQVIGSLQGVGAAAAQDIQDQYVRSSGQQAQGLINRGLGNTTVANSIQRGLLADKSKADVNLANQLASLYASYQSRLGGAQLDWMNSVMAKYPDPMLYYRLLEQRGAQEEARRRSGQAAAGMMGGGGIGSVSGLGGPSMLDRARQFNPNAGSNVQRSTLPNRASGSGVNLPPQVQRRAPGPPRDVNPAAQNYVNEQLAAQRGGMGQAYSAGYDEYGQYNELYEGNQRLPWGGEIGYASSTEAPDNYVDDWGDYGTDWDYYSDQGGWLSDMENAAWGMDDAGWGDYGTDWDYWSDEGGWASEFTGYDDYSDYSEPAAYDYGDWESWDY